MTNSTEGQPSIRHGALTPAIFLSRTNRFRVDVSLNGKPTAAHLANSGRLGELLVAGAPVWLRPAPCQGRTLRKTGYDLALVKYGCHLVSVDARLPNDLVELGLQTNQIRGLPQPAKLEREVLLGGGRIDFRVHAADDGPPCWIEVKSVTLVNEGIARFPDAPTARGRRHLDELVSAVAGGDCAAVVFCVQRTDADCFAPNDAADPAFGQTLRHAGRVGVKILALRCHVTLEYVRIMGQIPVRL